MRRYRFRALVTFDPAMREGRAPGPLSQAGTLTVHACCLLQPFCSGQYFPAVISRVQEWPLLPPGGHAVVTIALAGGEAEAYFAPGQGFTIWADGMAGHVIKAKGLIGYGVICGPGSPTAASRDDSQRDTGPARRSGALVRR